MSSMARGTRVPRGYVVVAKIRNTPAIVQRLNETIVAQPRLPTPRRSRAGPDGNRRGKVPDCLHDDVLDSRLRPGQRGNSSNRGVRHREGSTSDIPCRRRFHWRVLREYPRGYRGGLRGRKNLAPSRWPCLNGHIFIRRQRSSGFKRDAKAIRSRFGRCFSRAASRPTSRTGAFVRVQHQRVGNVAHNAIAEQRGEPTTAAGKVPRKCRARPRGSAGEGRGSGWQPSSLVAAKPAATVRGPGSFQGTPWFHRAKLGLFQGGRFAPRRR